MGCGGSGQTRASREGEVGSMAVPAVHTQAEALKAQGNQLFMKDKLGPAIDAYTEAIALCPTVSIYYTNRALCYRKRKDWNSMESDCQTALVLDKESIKAHYMLGLGLMHRNIYEEAVRELGKALQLAQGGKGGSGLVEEIWSELAKAKYTQWHAAMEEKRERNNKLRGYLQDLIKADMERRQAEIGGSVSGSTGTGGGGSHEETIDLETEFGERVNTLENVFDKAGRNDRPAEVPDHLCCHITMDIFRDPVITPSGISYERAVLMEHLRRGRKSDPVSGVPMDVEQIVPNLALREAVQTYLDDHGWAYGHVS